MACDAVTVMNFYTNPERISLPADGTDIATQDFILFFEDHNLMYDTLGMVFMFLKKEEQTMIQVLKENHSRNLEKHKLLKDLLKSAKESNNKRVIGSVCWLNRNFLSLSVTVENVHQSYKAGKHLVIKEEMNRVYKRDVARFHGFITRQLYQTALCYLLPDNKTILKQLSYNKEPVGEMVVIEDAATHFNKCAHIPNSVSQIFKNLEIDVEKINDFRSI